MIYDVIVVGTGPAGLTAAIYGQRARLSTLVLEKQPISGGQILNTYEVDNYPGLAGISGFDLGQKFREHADRLGVEFQTADVHGMKKNGEIFELATEKGIVKSRTVVIATGAVHSHLMVPGEEELSGMGVSYCATCDGAFFKNRVTAVVGGGDVALEDALFLARGCSKVYLIHRRDTFRGAKILQQRVNETDNIEIIYDSVVEEICGEEMVDSVRLYNRKEERRFTLNVNGVFIAVGVVPDSGCVKGLVKTDEKGYICAGEDCVTDVPGLFAAGDVRTKKLRQIVTAAADGANAIASVEAYLVS